MFSLCFCRWICSFLKVAGLLKPKVSCISSQANVILYRCSQCGDVTWRCEEQHLLSLSSKVELHLQANVNFWYQSIKIRQHPGSRLEGSSVQIAATATCSRENICLCAIGDLLYPSKNAGDELCIQIPSNLALLHCMPLRTEHLFYSFLPLKRSRGAAFGHLSNQVIVFHLPLLCLPFQLEKQILLCAFSCSSEKCSVFCWRGELCDGAHLHVACPPPLQK